jgi:DNA-binding NarL/FixJ family response regulator
MSNNKKMISIKGQVKHGSGEGGQKNMGSKIRILIADDEALLRDGIQTILDLEDDMEVVALASNGYEAYERSCQLRPDVVLLDVRMPGTNGVESLRLIKRALPQTIAIMLTTFNDEEYIISALAEGAAGYLLKDINADQLVVSIRQAYHGQLILPAKVAGKLAEQLVVLKAVRSTQDRKKAKSPIGTAEFTPRENEIATLMIQGLTNREIADNLGLTEGTIKNYISVIYSKLGTSDRTRAVFYLAQNFAPTDRPLKRHVGG